MQQEKFAVIYRKLWSLAKFGDKYLENATNLKWYEWQKSTSNSLTTKDRRLLESNKITNGVRKIAWIFGFRKYATLQNYSDHKKLESFKNRKHGLPNKRQAGVFGIRQWQTRREKADWIGDEMKGEIAKHAPSYRGSSEVYEAGKASSKEKCEGGRSRSKGRRGHDDESDCCPQEKIQCVKEVEPVLPPGEEECCQEEPPPQQCAPRCEPKKKACGNQGGCQPKKASCSSTPKSSTPAPPPCCSNKSNTPVACRKPCPPPCPPPCAPPCPPPCPPPPCCPKMEALQFDPMCKALNFYMLNAPTSIRKDEILVQVVYSGVCDTDIMIMDGKGPCLQKPVILGQEFTGVACAVGSGVCHIKCGDCIAIDPYSACHVCRYCHRSQFGACMNEGLNNVIGIHKDGGWAEFVVVHKNQVHLIPPCLGLAQAVLTLPLSCVVNAMSRLDIPLGSDILIQGAGISGCLWASVLHMQGHKNVTVCEENEYRRKLFECLNLKYCIITPDRLEEITADIVIDSTGCGKSIERAIRLLNSQGQLCIFGIPPPDEDARLQLCHVTRKELKILSVITNSNNFAQALSLAEMMGCRYLDYEKLGMQTFRLGQFEGAIRMKKCGEINKVVFKIQNSK
ncbi:UNVERIFIED_CONTAM: hypothetical protein PYX00_010094 [Menopon gallinae]|uniref:Alcohol dehydrogenase N-terminal domain-containing protein n=1 Tax=Menopon gallinae TaxID=328185 RepID=A0AAW2HE15_9NEOP